MASSSKNNIVIIANPGNGVFIVQTVLAYYEVGLLLNFYTSFVSNINTPFYNVLKNSKLKTELDRRSVIQIPTHFIKTYPVKEVIRTITSKLFNAKILDTVFNWSERSFDRWVANNISNNAKILHCYEHTSIEMMKAAKRNGMFIVYEQPSQHHSFLTPIIKNQLHSDKNLGGYSADLLINEKASARNIIRDQEILLSDLIICNSTFSKDTLIGAGVDENKIEVVPLAFPESSKINIKTNAKIRFIYAGTSNIRKGVHLLIKAWTEVFDDDPDVELLIVGRFDLPIYYKQVASKNIKFYDSIPRSELLVSFLDSDVLLLPTLADGFGMVITEAMSRGLCVITTTNSAGPDLINHEYNGILIKPGDLYSLKSALLFVKNNENTVGNIRKEALKSASKYQWADYRSKLVNTVIKAYEKKV
jgi:glycosyltransferase involved in cell wall biosynthesis